MTNNLRDLLAAQKKQKFATDAGTLAHSKMRRVIIDTNIEQGDPKLIQQVRSIPELLPLFSKMAKTEVPVAGIINGKFGSRRIDRMMIDDTSKTVVFLDYKTDINKENFRDKYIFQMREYAKLLRDIYPNYVVRGHILWLHDFVLETI